MTQPSKMTPRRAKINGLQLTVTMAGNMLKNGGLSFEMGAGILWVLFKALSNLYPGTGMDPHNGIAPILAKHIVLTL